MPLNKRLNEGEAAVAPPPSPPPPPHDDKMPDDCVNHGQNEDLADSNGNSSSSDVEKEEFIFVRLPEIRKEVQCPICLGIIRKTRTVMECLHRFCRECIDKSMRLGNNECPSCRTHCASRRSLRDDPNFDSLISVLYPDIDKYEEEEYPFHEEEDVRRRQIYAETLRRQTEALGKKRARKQGSGRITRGRRSRRAVEQHDSDEEEGANGNEGSKDSSSADEPSTEVKSKRSRRARTSRGLSGSNSMFDDKDSEANTDSHGGLVRGKEILKWGRGRVRSNNRRAGLGWAGGRGRLSKGERLSKLIEHLQGSSQNEEMKKCLTVVSLDEEKIPNLQRPYFCCSPKMSVGQLCQYVAMRTTVDASKIEILMIKDLHPSENAPVYTEESGFFNPCNRDFQLLDEHLTLKDIHAVFTQQNLVLAYRQKSQDEGRNEE